MVESEYPLGQRILRAGGEFITYEQIKESLGYFKFIDKIKDEGIKELKKLANGKKIRIEDSYNGRIYGYFESNFFRDFVLLKDQRCIKVDILPVSIDYCPLETYALSIISKDVYNKLKKITDISIKVISFYIISCLVDGKLQSSMLVGRVYKYVNLAEKKNDDEEINEEDAEKDNDEDYEAEEDQFYFKIAMWKG